MRARRTARRRGRRAVLAGAVTIGLLLGAGGETAWAGALLPERGGSPNADRIASLYTVVLVLAALVFARRRCDARLRVGALPRATQSGGGADPRQHAVGDRVDGRRGGADRLPGRVLDPQARCDRASRPRRRQSRRRQRPAWATAVAARCTSMSSAASTCGCTRIPNGAFSYEEMVAPVGVTVELDIVSVDVAHSWWIPKLGGKFDALPGYVNHTWFRLERAGVYTRPVRGAVRAQPRPDGRPGARRLTGRLRPLGGPAEAPDRRGERDGRPRAPRDRARRALNGDRPDPDQTPVPAGARGACADSSLTASSPWPAAGGSAG